MELFNKKVFAKNHFLLTALMAGILVGTSYIPYPAWAIFFCYIPLWFAVLKAEEQNQSYKFIFLLGWITQFTLSLIGFHWIYYTATEFGQLHPALAGGALFLFAALMHVYIPLSLIAATWMKRRFQISANAFIFLLSICLILSERLWPSIFEWNLGYTLLWMKWPWFQWADVIGFWGLSSVLLFIQALILYFTMNYKKKTTLSGLSILVGALIFFHYTGLMKEKMWDRGHDQFRITVAQGNILNEEKIAAEKGADFQPYVLKTYTDLVNTHFLTLQKKPDAILWPETALPFPLDVNFMNRANQQTLQNQINQWNTVLITGGYSQNLNTKDQFGHFKVSNSIFFLGPNNSAPQPSPYFKTDLLMLGEWMPFGREFPILYDWFPFVGVYEKGPGPVLKTIQTPENKTFNLGPQICYESLNPSFSRGLATNKADIILNATNDSWYGEGTEPFQHMMMTLARAVEVRRPLVRATNTGFTSAILASGQILERSPINQPWAHTYEINYKKNAQQSFYSDYGHFDYLFWILFLILIIFFSKGQHVRHQKS